MAIATELANTRHENAVILELVELGISNRSDLAAKSGYHVLRVCRILNRLINSHRVKYA